MALNDTLNIGTLTDKTPVLFVGHGNPMNAITDNRYSQRWKTIGEQLPFPITGNGANSLIFAQPASFTPAAIHPQIPTRYVDHRQMQYLLTV